MKKYNIETPVLALIVGLMLGNILKVPSWMSNTLKTDFYVKVGIVLMGASTIYWTGIKRGSLGN